MKTKIFCFLFVSLVLGFAYAENVPPEINYQGYLTSGYSGPSQVKVAILCDDGKTTCWSNDGTSVNGSEPKEAVNINATDGFFNIVLGDTDTPNMKALDKAIFSNKKRLYIRVWVKTDTDVFEMLAPDQEIVSTPYAISCDTADIENIKTALFGDFHNIGGIDDDIPDSDTEVPDNISINNISLYAPTGTGKVGIGKTDPATELDVNGTVTAKSFIGDGSKLTGIPTGQDTDWTIAGDNIYRTTGCVGIGTPNPEADLHVKGEVKADSILLENTAGTVPTLSLLSGSRDILMGYNNPAIRFRTNTAERMVIDSAGNVSIGKPLSPGTKLDVEGNIQGSDLISGGSNSWIFHSPDDGRTSMYITPKIGGNWDWSKQTRFDNNGNICFSGRVGMGTEPGFKLHVVDASSNSYGPAIVGQHTPPDETGIGIEGIGRLAGVIGRADGTSSGSYFGGYFEADNPNTGTNYGIYSIAKGGKNNYAGLFSGKVSINNGEDISKSISIYHNGAQSFIYSNHGPLGLGDAANQGVWVYSNLIVPAAKVSIGTTDVGWHKLYVKGDVYIAGNGTITGNWVSTSDVRWKTNIETLSNPLESIMRLQGVRFDWKREEFKDKNFPEGRQIGIIAQELEKEFPELVTTDKDGYKGVAYDKLTVVLLEAIKAQQKEIETLRYEIQKIKEGGVSYEN